MSRWISSKDPSKMETNYDMLTSQTYDMMNRMVRMFRRPGRGPRCAARALRPSSPKMFLPRSTFVTLWLTRKASARACRVGTTHIAKWTADPWAFRCSCCVTHCQLAVPHVWHKHTQGTGQDCRHEPNMTHAGCQILMSPSSPLPIEHICMVICFRLVSAVYPKVTHSNTFST